VTDGSQTLYWETEEDAYVPIGDTYADLRVKCQTTGEIGNGYTEGQINTIVDVFDYYSACENTEVSTGGADEATDDEYYQLLRLSLDAYSCAGPRNAYIYYAKKADASVADVKAIRPRTARTVTLPLYTLSGEKYAFLGGDELILDTLLVYPHGSSTAATIETDYTASAADGLLTITVTSGGALASETQIDVSIQETGAGRVAIYAITEDADGTTVAAGDGVKSKILAACNADEVRPLTDLVTVADPAPVSYGISFTYYLQRGGTERAADVEDAVDAAVEQYKVWQSAKLGRDINPSRLLGMLMQIPGIKRVELTAPSFAVLKDGADGSTPEYAVCTGGGGTSGGDEDE
jgi:phage-related baseplate assembly protein